ncbi:MAG: hypothetical protein RLY16_2154 [Bacteroidota bacterium]
MKHISTFIAFICICTFTQAQYKTNSITSTATQQWKPSAEISFTMGRVHLDATIHVEQPLQTIQGFGTCFNELGWTSLSLLSTKDREAIMKDLFQPGTGANLTICRMPIGANDFSRKWYSYNEQKGDFAMRYFSIANDLQTLIPFIKKAQQYNPKLQIWASPWSPPSWMKYNQHYASRSVLGNVDFQSEEWGMDLRGINNGLAADKEGKEGTDMFIQNNNYFKAYALYFSKFILAYRKQGIKIGMVMPQNEFNSAQVFPSCTWTPTGLANFISYLGPEMKKLGVKVFIGTVERGNVKLIDTMMNNPLCSKFVEGIGFQWAGKGAIEDAHRQYPKLTLYQSEQECGNSKNDWKYCNYAWDLMKHYLTNGANVYTYWNTSLKSGGISTWGWKQNSLISVDTIKKTYAYNYEYYLLKHVSHYVQPGAKLLKAEGDFTDLLSFVNPDKSIIIVLRNQEKEEHTFHIQIEGKIMSALVPAESFTSIQLNKTTTGSK